MLDQTPTLGLGTWPLSGPFFAGDRPLGYGRFDAEEAVRTIEAAVDHGIGLIDTAAVYGAGQGERLVGKALKNKPDIKVVTKVGLAFDEGSKQVTGPTNTGIEAAVEDCLRRLGRETVDVALYHPNEMNISEAEPVFAVFERLRQAGKVRGFGWSTDFPDKLRAFAAMDGFVATQYALNLFHDVPSMVGAVAQTGVMGMIRSPLAMGVLTGKFSAGQAMEPGDIRAHPDGHHDFFPGGSTNPKHLETIEAVRALLTTGGRSLVQGALGWLWARAPGCVPVPGARTVAQVTENAKALGHGPLPQEVFEEIERILDRPAEGPPRAR